MVASHTMISAIIPTLNEEDTLGQLLTDLQHSELITQIVVVDGGSTDRTVDVAESFGVLFHKGEKGRANQMNYGASLATNQILLFLHADSRIDVSSIAAIPFQLKHAKAGCFYLNFNAKNRWLDFYAKFSRLNLTLFTYGDQGLFIDSTFFNQINGYNAIPIMEDLDIVKRIKRKGIFKKAKFPITTSARRFKKNGVVWQQLKNVWLVGLYQIGFSPEFLSRYYKY